MRDVHLLLENKPTIKGIRKSMKEKIGYNVLEIKNIKKYVVVKYFSIQQSSI